MRTVSAGGLLVGWAASMLTAQVAVRVEVRLPAPVDEVVAAAVRAAIGDGVVVTAGGQEAAPPAPATVVVATATALDRLRREVPLAVVGDGAWVLPWSMRYDLVFGAGDTDRTGSWTFERLALEEGLRDRVALCGPEADPGPWLLGMDEFLRSGRETSAGYALWTTLDAQVGGYAADIDAARRTLVDGAMAAAVLPRPLLQRGLPAGAVARAALAPAGIPVGLAIVDGPATALPAARDAVDRLRRAAPTVAAAAGLDGFATGDPEIPASLVDTWIGHFDAAIRGRGRDVERVAVVLDYVFTALFLVVVLAILWFRRRGGHAPSSDVPDAAD